MFGGKVVRAPMPIHGKTSVIAVNPSCDNVIFNGLPAHFDVMRYHSLVIQTETVPEVLMVTAWLPHVVSTSDNAMLDERIIMAVQHKKHPTYGVQFHPESVMTEYGHAMLRNFLVAAEQFWQDAC